jgi:hypothetical protein
MTGVLEAFNRRAIFPVKLVSCSPTSMHTPCPTRAMPSHIAVDTASPIPSTDTLNGVFSGAFSTAVRTSPSTASRSHASPSVSTNTLVGRSRFRPAKHACSALRISVPP